MLAKLLYDMNANNKIMQALFEICKTESDRRKVVSKLIDEQPELIFQTFGFKSPLVQKYLLDWVDNEMYRNPDNGWNHTISWWCGYFRTNALDDVSDAIFDGLLERKSLEDIYSILQQNFQQELKNLEISSFDDMVMFVDDFEYEDSVLEVSHNLSTWMEALDDKGLEAYLNCKRLRDEYNSTKEKTIIELNLSEE